MAHLAFVVTTVAVFALVAPGLRDQPARVGGEDLQQVPLGREADPSHPRYLITEPGMGYRFEP
ncbi:hypothetical protein ACFWBI_32725 [Streptomyces sp. NPDC059982]|uniref:hypothetical protein n=1 Tax=unclassified Streptomyces TaxID=2593676 RepID=UPI0036A8C2B9